MTDDNVQDAFRSDEQLVATHVVDLMDQPGSLYALGSLRALQYQRRHVSTQII